MRECSDRNWSVYFGPIGGMSSWLHYYHALPKSSILSLTNVHYHSYWQRTPSLQTAPFTIRMNFNLDHSKWTFGCTRFATIVMCRFFVQYHERITRMTRNRSLGRLLNAVWHSSRTLLCHRFSNNCERMSILYTNPFGVMDFESRLFDSSWIEIERVGAQHWNC